MTEIPHSGCKLLLGRRMFIAIASSIVAQFFFVSCVIIITNLSITHPLSWLRDAWSMITCLRMWCYFFVLATVILLQGVICSKDYLSVRPYVTSRFEALCAMFTPRNFIVGSLHVAIGVVLVWLHLSLEDGEYSSLTKYCKSGHGYCLVEEHYFLLLGGLWTGLYHFARTNFHGLGYLEFPVIPMSKFIRVKRGISAVLPRSVIDAISPTLYLLAMYYFLGSYFRSIVASTLFLSVEEESLDCLSRLLNPSLIFHAWLYAALFVLTIDTMHLLFQASLTERTSFEIEQKTRFNNEETSGATNVTLPEALAMEKLPIIQHLGYLDLYTLAQKDKFRRSQLFALSQPGGHPYNWNCIVEKCLSLLAKFTTEIEDICSVKQEKTESTMKTTQDVNEATYAYHMRNLIDRQTEMTKKDMETEKQPDESIIYGYLRNKRDNFISYLLSKSVIFYFFGKQNDGKIRYLLKNGQTCVWAADAISLLAVFSLNEDPYGIVQKDLSFIIQNLLSLKQSLDKLQKMNILMRNRQNDDKTIRCVITSLRMAIKRSIYRIVSNFRDYIEDLSLDPLVRNQLQNFLVYRE